VAGLAAVLTVSLAADRWYLAFGSAVLAALGSFFAGGLLGFLFGVPRAGTNKRPVTGLSRSRGDDLTPEGTQGPSQGHADLAGRPVRNYDPNTNLEEVSDWLTKILLGAGLTQIRSIGTFFSNVGSSLGSEIDVPATTMTAIVVFYVVIGFHFFYLWTRLYLPELFVEAERRANFLTIFGRTPRAGQDDPNESERARDSETGAE
jgi:hypothetical protein